MSSNASRPPAGRDEKGLGAIGRSVQVALAIYLLPVVALVCVVGGASILIERALKATSRRSAGTGKAIRPCHVLVRPKVWAGMRLMPQQPGGQIRV